MRKETKEDKRRKDFYYCDTWKTIMVMLRSMKIYL